MESPLGDKMYPSIATAKSNPERLVLLLSPFRAKSLNPEHHSEKMKFWYRVVKEYSEHENKLSFSLKDVEQQLLTQCGRKPTCLREVFENLANEGEIISYEQFVDSLARGNTWFAWSTDKVKWVLGKLWSYSPVTFGSSEPKFDETTKFVYLPQLRTVIDNISTMSELTNQVQSLKEFKEELRAESGVADDLDLIVQCLKASGKLVTDNLKGQIELVKLVTPLSPDSAKVITQVEKGQYDIQRTTEILENDLEKLMTKRDLAENQARISLKAGKRATAKSYLRNKKVVEKRIEKLTNVLDTLSAIGVQIDDAESDAKVISAYEVGKKTLDRILKDNNLTTDRVNDVMLDIQDLMDDQADISMTLSQSLSDEDTTLAEQELEELLKEDAMAKAEEKALKDLDKLSVSDLDDLSPKKPTPEKAKAL